MDGWCNKFMAVSAAVFHAKHNDRLYYISVSQLIQTTLHQYLTGGYKVQW